MGREIVDKMDTLKDASFFCFPFRRASRPVDMNSLPICTLGILPIWSHHHPTFIR